MSYPKGLTRGWPLRKRLEFFSARHPSGCLIWCGALSTSGYGKLCIGRGKVFMAHRIAWEIRHGPIPAGVNVLHKCDIPSCIEVSHLFLGSHRDNMGDMARKLRAAKKLTPEIVIRIRKRTDSQHKIAKDYGISQSTVHEIRSGKIWSHLL